jgi:hypothetical protein
MKQVEIGLICHQLKRSYKLAKARATNKGNLKSTILTCWEEWGRQVGWAMRKFKIDAITEDNK